MQHHIRLDLLQYAPPLLWVIKVSNHRLQRLRVENDRIQAKLAQVRLVSRAKCLLIERKGLTEAEAHRAIEKEAMDSRRDRGEVAQEIIDTLDSDAGDGV